MSTDTKILLWLGFVVAVVIGGPLVSIWALNTLFPVLAIPYTFETWLAVILLGGVVNSRSFKSNT
jgi:hypothetical protein